MLGGQHHVSCAIKRVGACRKHTDGRDAALLTGISESGDREIDFSAFAASDPIALEQFDSLRPIESFKFI